MTPTDQIAEYLFRAGGKSFCDDCLSTALNLPLTKVQEAVALLAEEGWSKWSEGSCAACNLHKVVSRRRTSPLAC